MDVSIVATIGFTSAAVVVLLFILFVSMRKK